MLEPGYDIIIRTTTDSKYSLDPWFMVIELLGPSGKAVNSWIFTEDLVVQHYLLLIEEELSL